MFRGAAENRGRVDIRCVMRDDRSLMRTTLDLDADVLQAAKELAAARGSTAGKVLSELARKGLESPKARPRPQRRAAPAATSARRAAAHDEARQRSARRAVGRAGGPRRPARRQRAAWRCSTPITSTTTWRTIGLPLIAFTAGRHVRSPRTASCASPQTRDTGRMPSAPVYWRISCDDSAPAAITTSGPPPSRCETVTSLRPTPRGRIGS